jgi:5'-nucleotidase
MLILLSNDDGIQATGIRVLEEALQELGDVMVCAPLHEQSAQSHAFTMNAPVQTYDRGEGRWAVDGTPADCVFLGLYRFCPRRPDVVVSGINRGTNLGDDCHYSGTVAAAREGALHGVPSLAVSLGVDRPFREGMRHYETAALVAMPLVRQLAQGTTEGFTCLNLNVPNVPPSEAPVLRAARMGRRRYQPVVDSRESPRGKAYHWLGGPHSHFCDGEGTDGQLFQEGYATVVPMSRDLTDHAALDRLRHRIEKA